MKEESTCERVISVFHGNTFESNFLPVYALINHVYARLNWSPLRELIKEIMNIFKNVSLSMECLFSV